MNILKLYFIVLFLMFTKTAFCQIQLSGKVSAVNGEPLENTIITVIGESAYAISEQNGTYSLSFSEVYLNQKIRVGYSLLGYENQIVEVSIASNSVIKDVVLKSKNLQLDEVVVTAISTNNGVSNSSISIDEQAIELTQANSLKDVFSLLPGQSVENSDLQGAQTFAIRTSVSGPSDGNEQGTSQKTNAAFGTAIIVDGINQSNNANLSTTGDVNRGRSISLNGSTGNATTPGSGLDLRSIATENIESIEVVGGIASAKYGDFSDGAVIINQKAGVSPLRLSVRNNPGLVNTSVSKGLNLKKGGNLNLSGAYLYDNSDPTNDLKSFSRLTTNAIWSINPSKKWKNTVSANFSTNLDQSKTDPEINEFAKGEYNSKSFRIATRGNVKVDKKFSSNLNYNFGVSYGNNQVSEQRLLSSPDTRYTSVAVEEGVSQAVLVPFPYVANYTLDSQPLMFSASLGNDFAFKTGSILHQFSQGINYSLNDNKGIGTNYDLREPFYLRTLNGIDYSATKPDQFQDRNLAQHLGGVYLEDKFTVLVGEKDLDFSLGVRGDKMNEAFTVSPRLSTKLIVNDQFQLNAGYGKNSKSAPLAYLFPSIGYYEFPLTERPYFNPATTTQYYPLYTEVIDTSFSNIQPMVTDIYEIGGKFAGKNFRLSTSFYYKDTKNGFSTKTEAFSRQFALDQVDSENADGSVNTSFVKDSIYYGKFRSFKNELTSKTKGIELLLSTDKLRSIATSLDLNTAFTWGEYSSTGTDTIFPQNSTGFREENTANNIYLAERPDAGNSKDFNIKTALTTITHIPKLALVGTIRSEFFWISSSDNSRNALNPIAYYDQRLNYFPIPIGEQDSDIYADFRNDASLNNDTKTHFYSNFHLKLAKEFSNVGKLSFYANNFLNYRPLIERTGGQNNVFRANQVPQFGGELTITIK